jgi:hypothetical protein
MITLEACVAAASPDISLSTSTLIGRGLTAQRAFAVRASIASFFLF